MSPSLNFKLGRRTDTNLVGLDIQPGLVAAVQARVNGAILAERAAVLPLPSDTVREGDVVDEGVLSETLRELFATARLSKRVRVGVANQRTVMRTLELPPITDRKELAAAVRFQAQDQVPMPLANAVLDFHPQGVIETPAGPRQRVVLVAAQREMIDRLVAAVRGAGLTVEGIDLSAFAMIRALYRHDAEHDGRVLYVNVDGLTNVAIAEGTVCRFTRVVGGGLEAMAVELAERRGIPLVEARELLAGVDLNAPATAEHSPTVDNGSTVVNSETEPEGGLPDPEAPVGDERQDAPLTSSPTALAAEPTAPKGTPTAPTQEGTPAGAPTRAVTSDADVRTVLENGIRAISGEIRNSLEFHRTHEGGGEVSRVVLSGSALDFPGFAEALQVSLGVEVHSEAVGLADASLVGSVSTHRLAIATGLAAAEAPE